MSTSTSNFPMGPGMKDTFGAVFIGFMLAAVFYGVTNSQTYFYFFTYRRDPVTHKIAITWLWLLDSLHLALIAHALYTYLIDDFNNPAALDELTWCIQLQYMIELFVICTVQTLYSLRLLKFDDGRTKALRVAIGGLLLIAYGICLSSTYQVYTVKQFSDINKIRWSSFLSLATSNIIDTLIALAMIYYLGRARTGFQKTDSTISKLILYIVGTGLITSVCSFTAIITYAVMPNNLVWLCVQFVLTKLYVNSYLAMSNARHHLHGQAVSVHGHSRSQGSDHVVLNIQRRSRRTFLDTADTGTDKAGVDPAFVSSLASEATLREDEPQRLQPTKGSMPLEILISREVTSSVEPA